MDEEANKKCKMNPSDEVPAVVHVPSEISEQHDLEHNATKQLNKILLEREETIR